MIDVMEDFSSTRIHLAILTHNALRYTQTCLLHLRQNTPQSHCIHILDNASSDGSRDWLASIDDPRIRVHFSATNLGVAGGRNELMRLALPDVPDDGFLVFLDNDIDVGPGWADPFLTLFASVPEAGIASRGGNLIIVHEDRRQLMPWHESTSPVDVASGGFACWMRKAVCETVGAFDEQLGLFWQEDDDYAIRAIHLGWEVYAVPESQMVHHEHKSGVPEAAEIQHGGSVANARYLADKWRRLGFVDEDGWIIHPRSLVYLPVPVRRELQHRLGLQSPFDRFTFGVALREVFECISAPEAVWTWTPRVVSALHFALLDLFQEQAEGSGDQHAVQNIERARTALRGIDSSAQITSHSVPPTDKPKGTRRINKLCSADDWDDQEWRREAESLHWEAAGPGYHHRTMTIWMQVQIQVGLRELGLLQPESRGLLFASGRQPLLWSLAREVEELVAVDAYSQRGELIFAQDPESFAPIPVPPGRLQILDGVELPAGQQFDFICAPTLFSSVASIGHVEMVVRELARAVRPGGVLALGFHAHVGGGETALSPCAVTALLAQAAGCAFVEAPDHSVSHSTYEGLSSADSKPDVPPYLLHREGDRLMTVGVVFLQKVGSPSPATR